MYLLDGLPSPERCVHIRSPLARRATRAESIRREPPHQPVDRDVIDLDAALGQQLVDVA